MASPAGIAPRGAARARDLGAPLAAGLVAALLGYALARYGIAVAAAAVALPLGVLVLFERPFTVFVGSIVVALALPYTATVGTAQAAGFRIAAAGALAAVAVYALRGRVHVRWNLIDLAVACFVALTAASWLVSGVGSGADALNPLVPCAFYAAARILRPAQMWPALWAVAASGVIGAVSVLYEFFIVKAPLFVPSSEYLWNDTSESFFRPGGVYGSPPGAVVVLTMTALCTLPLAAWYRGAARLAAAACIAVTTAAAVATFTRAGLIGLVVGFVVYSLLAGSKTLSPRRVLAAGAVAVILLATFILPQLENNSFFYEGVIRPGNLRERESYWTLAIPLITDSSQHLALGHGTNALLAGRPGVEGTVGAGLSASPTLSKLGPHNQYVRTLLELGLAGGVLMLVWLVGAPARVALRARRISPQARLLAGGLAGAMAAFLVSSLANDTLRHPPSVAFAALATGLLVTLAGSADRPKTVFTKDGGT